MAMGQEKCVQRRLLNMFIDADMHVHSWCKVENGAKYVYTACTKVLGNTKFYIML